MSCSKSKGPIIDPGLCRCCGLLKKCRLLNVEYDGMGEKEIYCDMVMDCFGLLLSHLDGKPTERLICATCVRRLREASTFRKQVLHLEEVFLQMKMHYSDTGQIQIQHPALGDASSLEVEIKPEPPDSVHTETPIEDSQEEVNDLGSDSQDDMPILKIQSMIKPQCGDSPSKGHQELTANLSLQSPTIQKQSRCSMSMEKRSQRPIQVPVRSPLSNGITRPQRNEIRVSTLTKLKTDNIPMSKLQQRMREQDQSYITETNILTIVEYSYVCPFKCRHNNLLCYYCGENFLDPSLLREHTFVGHHPKKFKLTEHNKMIKIDLTRIDCRLCPAKIDDLEMFKKHITVVHNKKFYLDYKDTVLPFKLNKEDLKCALCEESFLYFHALNKHMNKHFSNYVCETCGLGFVDNGRFVMHQQRHEEGDFPCEICGKVFKALYNKDLHVDRVHKKRGRVYCPKCDMKLMSYPHKLKHLVEVHGEEPMSFSCDQCDKVYQTRRTLTIHRRKEHLKDYRYQCQCCGQKFFTRFSLTNHMPTHTGERNFKCKVCEKSYPRLKTLKDHMRIHTNDRRFRCHVCGQAFIQNCSLKTHMKSQHPEYG